MKSFFSIRAKFKVALLLLGIVTIILLAALLERKFFNDVHTSSASIYNDRLIPATAIFHISDNIYQQQSLYEMISDQPDETAVPFLVSKLKSIQEDNDSIITAFRQTYLTPTEEEFLDKLSHDLNDYYHLKTEMLGSNSHSKAHQDLVKASFEQIRIDLHKLSGIQTLVGKELLNSSKKNVARAHLITNLQIVAAIILSVICQILILTSQSVKSPIKQKHELN